MTKKEAVLVSAYTKYLLTKNSSDICEFCKELSERLTPKGELVVEDIQQEIRKFCEELLSRQKTEGEQYAL